MSKFDIRLGNERCPHVVSFKGVGSERWCRHEDVIKDFGYKEKCAESICPILVWEDYESLSGGSEVFGSIDISSIGVEFPCLLEGIPYKVNRIDHDTITLTRKK